MFQTDDPLVIPLWINGHVYLTMPSTFAEVKNPASGQVLRRTPLCGEAEALRAVEAARLAQPAWRAVGVKARAACCIALASALEGYADHFAQMIVEETGKPLPAASEEVADAVALLKNEALATDVALEQAVLACGGDSDAPLMSVLAVFVPAVLSGACVVIKPDPTAPSAIFALAELSAQCALPAGVLNIVHGDAALLDFLLAAV